VRGSPRPVIEWPAGERRLYRDDRETSLVPAARRFDRLNDRAGPPFLFSCVRTRTTVGEEEKAVRPSTVGRGVASHREAGVRDKNSAGGRCVSIQRTGNVASLPFLSRSPLDDRQCRRSTTGSNGARHPVIEWPAGERRLYRDDRKLCLSPKPTLVAGSSRPCAGLLGTTFGLRPHVTRRPAGARTGAPLGNPRGMAAGG